MKNEEKKTNLKKDNPSTKQEVGSQYGKDMTEHKVRISEILRRFEEYKLSLDLMKKTLAKARYDVLIEEIIDTSITTEEEVKKTIEKEEEEIRRKLYNITAPYIYDDEAFSKNKEELIKNEARRIDLKLKAAELKALQTKISIWSSLFSKVSLVILLYTFTYVILIDNEKPSLFFIGILIMLVILYFRTHSQEVNDDNLVTTSSRRIKKQNSEFNFVKRASLKTKVNAD